MKRNYKLAGMKKHYPLFFLMALFSTSVLSITDAQLKKELGDYLASQNSPVMQSESVGSALEFLTTVISRNFHIEQISAYQVNELLTHVGIVINDFLQNATSNAPENSISDPFDTLLNGGNTLNAALSNRPFFLRPEPLQRPAENLPMPYQGVLPQQLPPLQALSQFPEPPYQQLPPQQALFQLPRPPHQLPQAVFAQVRPPLPLHVDPARPGIRGLHQRNNNFIEAGQPIEVETTSEETEKTEQLNELTEKIKRLEQQQKKLESKTEQMERKNAKKTKELKKLAKKTEQLEKLSGKKTKLKEQNKQSQEGANQNKEKPPHKATYDQKKPKESNTQRTSSDREVQKLMGKIERNDREEKEKRGQELQQITARKKVEEEEKLRQKELARKKAEEEEKRRQKELARKKAEEEEKRRQKELARKKAEEEEKRRQKELARKKAEEEEKRRQKELARKKAEEEEKRRQKELARKKAEEEEKQRQKELARKKAEEEEKQRQEELARKKAEEEKRRQEWLARKKAERERQQQEKLARKKAKKEKERQEREQAQCQSPQKEQTNELLNTADLYNLRGTPVNLAIVSASPDPSMENLQGLQKHFPDQIKKIRQNIIKKNKNQPDKRSAQEESAKSNVLGDNTKSSEDVSQSNQIGSNRRQLEKATFLEENAYYFVAAWLGVGWIGGKIIYHHYLNSLDESDMSLTGDQCRLFLDNIISAGDGFIIKDSEMTMKCIVRLSADELMIPIYRAYIRNDSNSHSDFILYEPSGNNIVPNKKFFLAPAKMEKLSDISSEFGERYAVFLSNIHELLLNRSLTDGVRITNISAILCGVMPTKDLTKKCFLNVRDMIESFGIHAISSYYSFINAGHYDFKHYISKENVFVILPFWELDADENLVGRRYPVIWQENSYRPLFPLFDIPPDELIDPYTQGKSFFFNNDLKWIRHTNAFLSGQKTGLSQLKHFVAYESLPWKRYARIIGYDDGKQLHLAWEPDHGLRESHAAFIYMIYKHYPGSSQQSRKIPEELNAWFTSCLKSQACLIPWLRSDVTKLDSGYFQRVHKTYEIKAMSSGKIMRQWQKKLAFTYAASNLHSTGLTISQFADKARKLCGVLEHKKSQLACFLELADAHFSKLNWTKSPEILHYLENFDEYSPKIIWPKNSEYSLLPPRVLTPL